MRTKKKRVIPEIYIRCNFMFNFFNKKLERGFEIKWIYGFNHRGIKKRRAEKLITLSTTASINFSMSRMRRNACENLKVQLFWNIIAE